MAYRAKGIRTLGILQMVVGVLMGIFGIGSLAAIFHWSSYSGCGLWIGTWVFLTGLFGYLGARSDSNQNNCLIGLMLGFAVTACVFTGIMVIVYSIAVADLAEIVRCSRNHYFHCYHSYYYYRVSYNAEAGMAVAVILLLFAIGEFFIALASSIYGCNACCGGTTTSQPPTQQVAYVGPHQGNVIIVPAGGYYAGSTVQTVTTYPTQPNAAVLQMPGAQPVYAQQQYAMQQGQAFNPPPPHLGAANPAFQAQNQQLPSVEKPPPYFETPPQ